MWTKEYRNEYIILQVNNTPTVDLAGTAVASAIKKHFPERKIIVTTNFPEIWLHNPDIYRVYRFGQTPYFHEDYIRGRETKIFAFDPTKSDAYVNNEKHLVEAWCDLCGVPFAGEKPSLHFTQRESEVAWRMTRTNRPLFFFQPYEMFGNVAHSGWSWPKDIPISVAHKISHEMSMAGYAPIMIKNQNQMQCTRLTLQMSLRQTLAATSAIHGERFVEWIHLCRLRRQLSANLQWSQSLAPSEK